MVNVTDPARHAAQLMRSAAVRRLPVVDGEGRIVGIVSIGDLALALDRGSALAEISLRHEPNTIALEGFRPVRGDRGVPRSLRRSRR